MKRALILTGLVASLVLASCGDGDGRSSRRRRGRDRDRDDRRADAPDNGVGRDTAPPTDRTGRQPDGMRTTGNHGGAAGGRHTGGGVSLPGTWQGQDQSATVRVEFQANGRFTMNITPNAGEPTRASGTWALTGNRLEILQDGAGDAAVMTVRVIDASTIDVTDQDGTVRMRRQ